MTRWHETGLHSFLTRWHDTGLHSFLTRWHETGTHPFYIAMYIHIYTHIYVHIYTSQKECLCIFYVRPTSVVELLVNYEVLVRWLIALFILVTRNWSNLWILFGIWVASQSPCCLINPWLISSHACNYSLMVRKSAIVSGMQRLPWTLSCDQGEALKLTETKGWALHIAIVPQQWIPIAFEVGSWQIIATALPLRWASACVAWRLFEREPGGLEICDILRQALAPEIFSWWFEHGCRHVLALIVASAAAMDCWRSADSYSGDCQGCADAGDVYRLASGYVLHLSC